MSGAGGERVVVVDRANVPVDVAPRARVRAERLTHRATFIFVVSSRGELLVQRRTATKDLYPGWRFQIQRQGFLVTRLGEIVQPHELLIEIVVHPHFSHHIKPVRCLDLDDFCAQHSQLVGAKRPGEDMRQIQYSKSFERLHGRFRRRRGCRP